MIALNRGGHCASALPFMISGKSGIKMPLDAAMPPRERRVSDQAHQSSNGEEAKPSLPSSGPSFAWHPGYKGRSVDSVRRELVDELRRDQRTYELSLQAAEQDEHASLQAIVKLDNRWCDYDLGWTEANVDQMADRVLKVEQERDRRQEMFPVKEMRDSLAPVSTAPGVQPAGNAEDGVASSAGMPRWAYILITVLVVIGLIALLARVF